MKLDRRLVKKLLDRAYERGVQEGRKQILEENLLRPDRAIEEIKNVKRNLLYGCGQD